MQMGDLAMETTPPPGCVLLGCGPWRSVESKPEGQGPLLCPGSPTSEPQRVNLSGPPPSAPQFPHLPPAYGGGTCMASFRPWPPGEVPLGPAAIGPR